MAPDRFAGQHLLFVTGRLAEPALRRLIPDLMETFGLRISVQTMPITVAALMSPEWIARHLQVPEDCDIIVLPGYCQGEIEPLQQCTDKPILFGPRDLRQLTEFLGGTREAISLQDYSIQIIAEINHAPRLPVDEILRQALDLVGDGADIIDVGCQPGQTWSEVGLVVRELVSRGITVSIDSLNPREIAPAVDQGASLVLSVNASNRRAALDWDCEVVVIPDDPADWLQLGETVEYLAGKNVPLRIDPILEPIGFGFARSLSRYLQAREIWPEAAMMMGIGNLSELTDVDSAGVNFLLLAICEELGIGSVLTTQVINWARSSVRECDWARRMVHYAICEKVPPKNLSDQLVCLRDPQLKKLDLADIQELATRVRDQNYRILAGCTDHQAGSPGMIHLLGGGRHWQHQDAFELFHQLLESDAKSIDASHAFYLGYEMCKATIANQLGKNYEQDEALDWGHLTVSEVSHRRLQRRARSSR